MYENCNRGVVGEGKARPHFKTGKELHQLSCTKPKRHKIPNKRGFIRIVIDRITEHLKIYPVNADQALDLSLVQFGKVGGSERCHAVPRYLRGLGPVGDLLEAVLPWHAQCRHVGRSQYEGAILG